VSSRQVTVLWAPRSPCNLSCEYCYFGTLESQQPSFPLWPGQLSHIGSNDLTLDRIIEFLKSCPPGLLGRVFIAGGEPLLWRGIMEMITALKDKNIEVIVCTNGQPLKEQAITESLLTSGIDAVSVSLDSYDATYNDRWRKDRSGVGWEGVVNGTRTLLRARESHPRPCRVGMYMVVTALNVGHILGTAHFAAELGMDYFVFQPVSLNQIHPLEAELSLTKRHWDELSGVVSDLFSAGLPLTLPNSQYVRLVLDSINAVPPKLVSNCFGGRDLFFIEPDGSVWDCPSWLKIQGTTMADCRSIRDSEAEEVFSAERRGRCTDCGLFSVDCVNMWQLMAFDEILYNQRDVSTETL
jgi:MoaA/NifB/PqqE/SkfB family radical SAM enzyme